MNDIRKAMADKEKMVSLASKVAEFCRENSTDPISLQVVCAGLMGGVCAVVQDNNKGISGTISGSEGFVKHSIKKLSGGDTVVEEITVDG